MLRFQLSHMFLNIKLFRICILKNNFIYFFSFLKKLFHKTTSHLITRPFSIPWDRGIASQHANLFATVDRLAHRRAIRQKASSLIISDRTCANRYLDHAKWPIPAYPFIFRNAVSRCVELEMIYRNLVNGSTLKDWRLRVLIYFVFPPCLHFLNDGKFFYGIKFRAPIVC